MKKKKCCSSPAGGKPGPCLLHEPRVHGFLQAAMLLSLTEGPKHGYDLLKVLETRLPPEMIPDKAVVYRMLRELETGGYTRSQLEPGQGGPARKVYFPAEPGIRLLRDWRGIISRRVEMLEQFIERFDRLETAGGLHTDNKEEDKE